MALSLPFWRHRPPARPYNLWNACSLGVRHFEHQFAGVFPFEKLQEHFRKVFEALSDVLARLEFSSGVPAGHFSCGFTVSACIVEYEKTLHGGAIYEERKVV